MFKKGLIIVNAYCVYASIEHQANRLVDEFKKLGIALEIRENNFAACHTENGEIKLDIGDVDFVIYLDKDYYQAHLIEKAGVPVFNNAESTFNCDDKMVTHIRLTNNGIIMPRTVSAPFCSRNINEFDFSSVVMKYLKFPIVCKECYVSLGAQTVLVNNEKELRQVEERMVMKKHFYQEYLTSSRGHDIRAVLVNKKVIAAMDRRSKDDFRPSMDFGNSDCHRYELTEDYREVAEKVASILNLDYCGVDILIGDKGEPIICDVDSNLFFKGIESCTGVNVAEQYAKFVISKVYTDNKE